MSRSVDDSELLSLALSALEEGDVFGRLFRKGGRPLLFLPRDLAGRLRVLDLYPPQRRKAQIAAVGLGILIRCGLEQLMLPSVRQDVWKVTIEPVFGRAIPGTAGVLLGSPEHKVRRAVLSYRTENGWEVAKLAAGEEGREVIEGEAAVVGSIPQGTAGIPELRGVHHGLGEGGRRLFTMLRMPNVGGEPLKPKELSKGLDLLGKWVGHGAPKKFSEFPEWGAIRRALEKWDDSRVWLDRLAYRELRPVVRHGDFARWNLRTRRDGSVVALDWEWGHAEGMPGLDLVHLVMQDYRLVWRKSAEESLTQMERFLKREDCREYMQRTGWNGAAGDMVVAAMASDWGTGQQENSEELRAAIRYFHTNM